MSDRGGRASDRTESPSSSGETAGSRAPTPSSAGRLVVGCGLPGVGKTTVAERIAAHVDGRIRRTDVIRKELFDDPEYTDAETEAVYAELLSRARADVADGDAVVLDATFANDRFRSRAREVATETDAGFDLVEVACDEDVVERRIERRDGISDADFEIYLHFRELFDDVSSEHVVVDNSGTESETFGQVDAAFGGSAAGNRAADRDDRSAAVTDAE